MHPPRRISSLDDLDASFFMDLGKYIKHMQTESGVIPSNVDGSHDPWDHIESIMGLNFLKESSISFWDTTKSLKFFTL